MEENICGFYKMLFLAVFHFVHLTSGKVVIEVGLLKYKYTSFRSCDNILIFTGCDPFFKICFQTPPDTSFLESCEWIVTSGVENRNELTDILHETDISPNPIFWMLDTWKGELTMRIQVWDANTISHHNQIDEAIWVYTGAPNVSLYNETIVGNNEKARMTVYIRIHCEDNYHGFACTRFCEPTLNFSCDETGVAICLTGSSPDCSVNTEPTTFPSFTNQNVSYILDKAISTLNATSTSTILSTSSASDSELSSTHDFLASFPDNLPSKTQQSMTSTLVQQFSDRTSAISILYPSTMVYSQSITSIHTLLSETPISVNQTGTKTASVYSTALSQSTTELSITSSLLYMATDESLLSIKPSKSFILSKELSKDSYSVQQTGSYNDHISILEKQTIPSDRSTDSSLKRISIAMGAVSDILSYNSSKPEIFPVSSAFKGLHEELHSATKTGADYTKLPMILEPLIASVFVEAQDKHFKLVTKSRIIELGEKISSTLEKAKLVVNASSTSLATREKLSFVQTGLSVFSLLANSSTLSVKAAPTSLGDVLTSKPIFWLYDSSEEAPMSSVVKPSPTSNDKVMKSTLNETTFHHFITENNPFSAETDKTNAASIQTLSQKMTSIFRLYSQISNNITNSSHQSLFPFISKLKQHIKHPNDVDNFSVNSVTIPVLMVSTNVPPTVDASMPEDVTASKTVQPLDLHPATVTYMEEDDGDHNPSSDRSRNEDDSLIFGIGILAGTIFILGICGLVLWILSRRHTSWPVPAINDGVDNGRASECKEEQIQLNRIEVIPESIGNINPTFEIQYENENK